MGRLYITQVGPAPVLVQVLQQTDLLFFVSSHKNLLGAESNAAARQRTIDMAAIQMTR
jgi:hypothetical protein